jgi:hypothetical protein
MPPLDDDTIVKVVAACAVIIAAVIAALVGLYTQIKIKQFELRAQARKDAAAQRLGFYVPLLRFCYELDGRIGRILSALSTDWLRSTYLEQIRQDQGFAEDPRKTGYFIMSSVYVFACFFGWTEAIKKGVDATKPMSERARWRRALARSGQSVNRLLRRKEKTKVFFFDHDISVVRRLFQYQELFKHYAVSRKLSTPRDANKLQRHLQHSIGEMMLQPDGDGYRCKTFREFYEAYRASASFRYWFVSLEELLRDLSDFESDKDVETQAEMKDDIRPLRLLAIRYWSRVLMKNLAKDLGIKTPPPEDVIASVSGPLRTAITFVTSEDLELYIKGIPVIR